MPRFARQLVRAAVVACCLPAAAASAQAPRMSRAEVMAMFAAGGFPAAPNGKGVVNRCGQPANPRVKFIDINNDRRPDALFVDAGTCYVPDRHWFAIATKVDGTWRQVVGAVGSARAAKTSTNGWQDIIRISNGVEHLMRYDGTSYQPRMAVANNSPDRIPTKTASGDYPTDGWARGVKATALSDIQFAAIMRAGGYRKSGGSWHGCEGSTTVKPSDVQLKDLNGDGRPEAIVSEESTACYGMAGQGFQILRPVPGGWQSMTSASGIPDFQATRGVGGYPDIEIGGPGFCFPVVRWNGSKYLVRGYSYEGKACNPN